MPTLRLTDSQTASLEDFLTGARSHYRHAADKALRACNRKGADHAQTKVYEADELLHALKMAQIGVVTPPPSLQLVAAVRKRA